MQDSRQTEKGLDQSAIRLIAGVIVILGAALLTAHGRPAQTQVAGGSGAAPTAAEKYKNIKVLKDIPADQLIPTMQFISGSLGVECGFCHVAGPDKRLEFDKDDKKEKKTARDMMQMMFAINKNNFEGEREVTCNTCHRGSPHPQAIPAVLTVPPEAPEAHDHGQDPASLPSGAPVLAKYIQAIGGQTALHKVSTRVETGQALIPQGGGMPITIYTKAPDQRVSVMHTPKGENVTAYNGHAGWLNFPGAPPRKMSASDQLAAKLDAEVFYPTELEKQFTELKLDPHPDKIGDHETDVVLGLTKGQPPVKLYFDRGSGLLVRMVHYTDTALGLLPIQLDFADYREVGGVKTPYRWTLGRPSGSFTIQIDKVEQNVAIDEALFAEPKFAAPPPMGSAPGGHATPSGAPHGPKPPQGSVPSGGAPPNPSSGL